MGFEEVVPKLPTRQEELAMISKMEADWIAQPSYKVYMNEAPRKNKLEFFSEVNNYYRRFLVNFLIGSVISGPIIIMLGRLPYLNRMASGVPFYRSPRYYNIQSRSHNHFRFQKQILIQFPIWAFMSLFYANKYTSTANIDDEYFTNKAFKKML